MQKVKLPHSVEPTKSAMKRSDYRGVIASKDMERLSEAVVRCNDYVDAEVQFEKDAQGLTVFHGHLATQVTLICQRCNGELDYPVEANSVLLQCREKNRKAMTSFPRLTNR